MTEELKKARDRVLVDNTAQAVFKHLDRLEDNRTTLGLRWIWELLQNARDAAQPSGVHIKVRLSEDELRFEHDGKPFTSGEIAHLVYHGSTKIEDFNNVGQFGSGFLSTHLVSRIVRVRGRLDDSRGFAFSLDRTCGTVDDLRKAMDRSWEAFEQSVEDADSAIDCPTTSFVYVITEEGRTLAREGLAHLHRCGPLVLAFCPEIKSVAVETTAGSWSLQCGHHEPFAEGGGILTIQCQHNNGQTLSRFVAITEGGADVCAALQLCRFETHLAVDQLEGPGPKLFVLFPLIGSERLAFPVAVNSKLFKPREDRDGIVLHGDSPGARENRRLLEESARHQGQLLEWCAREKWAGAEQLLALDTTHLPDWVDVDGEWFLGLLSTLVRSARAARLMPTLGGDWIAPQAAWLPTTDDEAHGLRLWDLMSAWTDAPSRLPRRDDVVAWSRNLSNWARLLGKSPFEMDEALTINAVAQLISEAENVERLNERLSGDDSLPWLVSFLRLVQEAGQTKLLDEHNLLPSQAGRLRRRSELRCDDGIADDLKDIAEAFDLDIRSELLHPHAEIDGIADLLSSESEPELLDKLLARLKHECQDGTIASSRAPWVVRLFWWMAARAKYLDRLDGLPVPTTEEDNDRITVLDLERRGDADGRPLAPVSVWPDDARPFASLFPKRKLLAAAFADGDQADQWRVLAEHGYVNVSPLIETKRGMAVFVPDEPLPKADGTESHKSTQSMEVSHIAFLTEPDIGLIDTARKSRTRAIEFIRFLVEFAVGADERAFEQLSVDCECGQSHEIYRAAWLVPLYDRRWVPMESNRRRAAPASAESLASLLTNAPDVAELLSGERGKKLLKALGISPADLALRVIADDEETRVALIRSISDLAEATGGDFDRVRDLANEIREHPEIIKAIEEQKVRRKKVQRNQMIGRLVEELLRQELKDRRLTVRRTGRGSDFEVESDFIENNEEIWLEVVGGHMSTLIEVKSTRVDQVKMTPLQVETACSHRGGFALCVVPLHDDSPTRETVREHLRVVFGIGENLDSVWKEYKTIRNAAHTVRRHHGAIELEIIEGQVRFRIGREIWGEGLGLAQAVKRFSERGEASDADS